MLTCTPSYALHLFEAAKEMGIDFRELPLRIGIHGAEPWTESMRNEIENKLGITAIDIYGLSEIMGPGVAIECAKVKKGLHIQEDHFLAEIIDSDTGEQMPAGEKGELVITHKGEIIKPEKYMWSGEGFRSVGAGSVQPGYLISTIPHPDGWVTIRSVKEWNGTKLQATLYSSVNFSALETALRCEKGTFDVRAWLANFGRHPQKGFGRFYFRVQPGGASWDQMFISVDDRLRDRIELLMQLPDPEDVAFPENVWHLPARLVSKKDKGGHLVWDESNRQGMIAWKRGASWVQMSRRSSGSFISHRSTGTAAAWSLSASTNKHNHTMVVALIGEGEELHLDSGIAVRNNGGKLDEVAAVTAERQGQAVIFSQERNKVINAGPLSYQGDESAATPATEASAPTAEITE